MTFQFDQELIKMFRDRINSTYIFYEFEEYKTKWNLICAVMDRVDHVLKILNNKSLTNTGDLPHDTIIALVYIDILVKSIKELYKNLGIDYKLNDEYIIFNKRGLGTGTDDKFFNYIRTLAFAHPVSANKHRSYIQTGETHYCPYITDGRFVGKNGEVNLRIYSSVNESFIIVNFSPNQLVSYAMSRYKLLSELTKRVDDIIKEYIFKFKSRIIPIGSTPAETLKNIIEEAHFRHDDDLCYEFEEYYQYLIIQISNPNNKDAVSKYRQVIEQSIPELHFAYQNLDTKLIDECRFLNIFSYDYSGELSKYSYELSKIRTYLTQNYVRYEDISYGYNMLEVFKEFSDKYVIIDKYIPFEEIQLLVETAIYLHNNETERVNLVEG